MQTHHHLARGLVEHEERGVVPGDLDPFCFEFYLDRFFLKSAWGLCCHAERISVKSVRDAFFKSVNVESEINLVLIHDFCKSCFKYVDV